MYHNFQYYQENFNLKYLEKNLIKIHCYKGNIMSPRMFNFHFFLSHIILQKFILTPWSHEVELWNSYPQNCFLDNCILLFYSKFLSPVGIHSLCIGKSIVKTNFTSVRHSVKRCKKNKNSTCKKNSFQYMINAIYLIFVFLKFSKV